MAHNWSDTSSKVKEKRTTTAAATATAAAVSKTVRESKGSGSRRIFSPVFKLQVLDSYRQDADCQGNQRATARKYGIHRRQIQKWLQMEQNLRLSVQQTNATALNLSPARQSDGGKGGAVSPAPCRVRRTSPVICNGSDGVKDVCEASESEEEYVNVDEITDSEGDETSSCCSCERADRALDLTRATLSKRRVYTPDFKLHVLEAFGNDETCKGDHRATAKKFGLRRRHVQKWLNEESVRESDRTLGNACLDLTSYKRKPHESVDDVSECKRKILREDESQESALCLVKSKFEPVENSVVYPLSALEHSYSNSSLNCSSPDFPFCIYQPWNCCCPDIPPAHGYFDTVIPKYSYALNVKYEMPYVDIPVQYGFGDSLPSKWIKENPFYVHESPTIQVLSSYR